MCVCVCVCVYTYIHTYTHTHIHRRAFSRVLISTRLHVCMYVCMYITFLTPGFLPLPQPRPQALVQPPQHPRPMLPVTAACTRRCCSPTDQEQRRLRERNAQITVQSGPGWKWFLQVHHILEDRARQDLLLTRQTCDVAKGGAAHIARQTCDVAKGGAAHLANAKD